MLATVALKGIPSPKTLMPTAIPLVLFTTRSACPAAPVAVAVAAKFVPHVVLVGPPKVTIPETMAVLAGDRLTVLPETPVTVAPVAIPIPRTVIPTEIPEALPTVMAVSPRLPLPDVATDDVPAKKPTVKPGKLSLVLSVAANSTYVAKALLVVPETRVNLLGHQVQMEYEPAAMPPPISVPVASGENDCPAIPPPVLIKWGAVASVLGKNMLAVVTGLNDGIISSSGQSRASFPD
jgi:hypothetical protein